MNDLDFDRLRADLHGIADEAAPADLHERAVRTSRTRRRRQRAAAVLTVAAVFVVGAFTMVPTQREKPPVLRPTPTPTVVPTQARKPPFIPPTHSAPGGREVMPLTLPDGTRAEVSYPKKLALAEIGFRPRREAQRPESLVCCSADTSLQGTTRLLRTLPDSDGRPLEIWSEHYVDTNDELGNGPDYTVDGVYARFGRWYVLVQAEPVSAGSWPRITATVRAMRLRETAEGFLTVDIKSPPQHFLKADAPDGDVWGGPILESASLDYERQRQIEFTRVTHCGPTYQYMELESVQICKGGLAVRFAAEKDKDQAWLDDLRRNFRIDSVTLSP